MRRSMLQDWISVSGGHNTYPCRTVGETAQAANAAGISGLTISEIIAAQDYETEMENSISDSEFDALFGEIETASEYTKRNPRPSPVGKVDISTLMLTASLGEIAEIDNGLTTHMV